MHTVNSELLRMARSQFNKAAVAPPPAPPGGDPAAAGAGAPPAMDPSAMAAVPSAPMDMGMGAGAAPAPAPAPAPAQPQGQAAPQQKLKPEQMMQMIDYRMYNMQQQLTAIMNALGVQLPPEAIVLPPGSTSAPPAESALPGAPGAPTPTPPAGGAAGGAAGGGAGGELPTDVYAGQDPAQTGGAVQPIPPVKAANWWDTSTVREKLPATPSLQETAGAALALYRSRAANVG